MNEEEKKAIERIDYIQDFIIENGQYNADISDMQYFSKILNLIEKQQKELEKKDKTIDLMANNIADSSNVYENLVNTEFEHTKEEVIEYFTKKADETNG